MAHVTRTTVRSSTTPVDIVPANADRMSILVSNFCRSELHLWHGAPAGAPQHVIEPFEVWAQPDPIFTGAIIGEWPDGDGLGAATVADYTFVADDDELRAVSSSGEFETTTTQAVV